MEQRAKHLIGIHISDRIGLLSPASQSGPQRVSSAPQLFADDNLHQQKKLTRF